MAVYLRKNRNREPVRLLMEENPSAEIVSEKFRYVNSKCGIFWA